MCFTPRLYLLFGYIAKLSYIIAAFVVVVYNLTFLCVYHSQFTDGNSFNLVQINIAVDTGKLIIVGKL